MRLQYIATLALAITLLFSCESNDNKPNDDGKLDDTTPASITLRSVDIAEEQITFELCSEDASEVRWMCVMQSATTLDGATIMAEGTEAEANTSVEITAEGLVAGMTYEIYAAASNGTGEITMASTLVVQTIAKIEEDATYVFSGNITAYVYTMDTNGLRNDYVSFYDNATDRTLFIDFYSAADNSYLPTGTYPLGDGSAMTSDQRYTYITLFTGADFACFTEGSAQVTAHVDEATGEVAHSVTARYTLENGETVSLNYAGTFVIKQ